MADQIAKMAKLADLAMQYSCPNAPAHFRCTAYSVGSSSLCKESTCTFCPDVGFVWTSDFCVPGHWKKKPKSKFLNPYMWRNLPTELLLSVFARLPTDGISRTRALSKEWNLALSASSPFIEECAKLQPYLCALLGYSVSSETCWVRMYDASACKWHAFNIDGIPNSYSSSFLVCDAGLACFVPCADQEGQPILICNPLTREWRQLPLRNKRHHELGMVQLRVDRDSGLYKVILIALWSDAAEVYDSKTNKWSDFVSGSVLAATFFHSSKTPIDWLWEWHAGYGVYDGATKSYNMFNIEFEEFYKAPNSRGESSDEWRRSAFENHLDELYLLLEAHSSPSLYNVVKYKEGTWRFDPFATFDAFDGLPRLQGDPEIIEFEFQALWTVIRLLVCKRFFLVVGQNQSEHHLYRMKLYDMENQNWIEEFDLECTENWPSVLSEDLERAALCELRWDAIP